MFPGVDIGNICLIRTENCGHAERANDNCVCPLFSFVPLRMIDFLLSCFVPSSFEVANLLSLTGKEKLNLWAWGFCRLV